MARPGLFGNRKFKRLSRALNDPATAAGSLELIWSSCYENGDDYLGESEDVEAAAFWKGEPGKLTQALLSAGGTGNEGFIEELKDRPGHYIVHDLYDHAPDYVQKRMQREAARVAKGKTISDLRREAGKHGRAVQLSGQTADSCPLLAAERQTSDGQEGASIPTPAPAPAPREKEPPTPLRGSGKPPRKRGSVTWDSALDWVIRSQEEKKPGILDFWPRYRLIEGNVSKVDLMSGPQLQARLLRIAAEKGTNVRALRVSGFLYVRGLKSEEVWNEQEGRMVLAHHAARNMDRFYGLKDGGDLWQSNRDEAEAAVARAQQLAPPLELEVANAS